MLADFDFTKFRHFQPVKAPTCFTDRVLTDTFTCLKFVFSQTPQKRTDRTLEFWIPFLFRFRVFASAKEVINGRVYTFDGGHLHILRMFAIMRVFAQFLQMVYLVVTRYRDRTVIIHLRAHLKHVVIQLLLVLQLCIKPAFLCRRGIRPIFKCAFHRLSRITSLTPIEWVGRHVTKR